MQQTMDNDFQILFVLTLADRGLVSEVAGGAAGRFGITRFIEMEYG